MLSEGPPSGGDQPIPRQAFEQARERYILEHNLSM